MSDREAPLNCLFCHGPMVWVEDIKRHICERACVAAVRLENMTETITEDDSR